MTLRRNSSSGQENKPVLGVCGGGREGGREERRDGERGRRAAPGCPPHRGGRERQPGRARKRHREAPGRSELRRWEAGSRGAEEPGSAPPGGRRRSGAAPSPRQPAPSPRFRRRHPPRRAHLGAAPGAKATSSEGESACSSAVQEPPDLQHIGRKSAGPIQPSSVCRLAQLSRHPTSHHPNLRGALQRMQTVMGSCHAFSSGCLLLLRRKSGFRYEAGRPACG